MSMKILRISEVARLTGLSRWTIFRMEKAGRFPKRVQLSAQAIGWHESSILRWLKHREEIQPLKKAQGH